MVFLSRNLTARLRRINNGYPGHFIVLYTAFWLAIGNCLLRPKFPSPQQQFFDSAKDSRHFCKSLYWRVHTIKKCFSSVQLQSSTRCYQFTRHQRERRRSLIETMKTGGARWRGWELVIRFPWPVRLCRSDLNRFSFLALSPISMMLSSNGDTGSKSG